MIAILISFIITFGLCVFVGVVLISWLESWYTPEYVSKLQGIANSTMKTLDSKNLTCQQIQDLRIAHTKATTWEKDPLHYDYVFDHARDLWNIKSCGVKWGWFEN